MASRPSGERSVAGLGPVEVEVRQGDGHHDPYAAGLERGDEPVRGRLGRKGLVGGHPVARPQPEVVHPHRGVGDGGAVRGAVAVAERSRRSARNRARTVRLSCWPDPTAYPLTAPIVAWPQPRVRAGCRQVGCAHERHEGRHPRRWTGHPLPPRDQGHAEGDAARRRQAGDPVRRGGVGARRSRRRARHHRSQQGRPRGPLRPQLGARGRPRGQGRRAPPRAGPGVGRPRQGALRPAGPAARARPRRPGGQGARRQQPVRGAARRRPHRQPRPPPRGDGAGARGEGRQRHRPHGGARGVGPPLRLRRRRPAPGRRRAHHGPGREARRVRGAEQPRHHRPLRPRPLGLRGARAHQAGARRRDPAHRRPAGARHVRRPGRRGPRRDLPRSPLRHRGPARLPQGRRQARPGAPRARPGLRRLARRVRRGAGPGAQPR